MNSNDPTSTNTNDNEFTGIWDREHKSNKLTATAESLAAPLPEKGAERKKKPWGLTGVILTFLAFLAGQVILALVLGVIALKNSDGSADGLSTALSKLLASPTVLIASSLSMYVVWIGGMFLTTRFKGARSFKKDFKFSFRWYDPLIGLGLAAFFLGFVQAASWFCQDVLHLNMAGSDNGTTFTSLKGAGFFIVGFGVVGFLGPLCEELFFRGYILQATAKSIRNHFKPESKFSNWLQKYQYVIAAILSSVVFGSMHFQGVQTFGQWFVVIITGSLGLVFAITAIKLKRIGAGIFGHMFYNSSTILIAYLSMHH